MGKGSLRVVVVGSGRTGLRAIRQLDAHGHDVIVVERNADQIDVLEREYLATCIEGDATRPSILEQANVERADVVAALTDTMGTNVAVCTTAKRIDPSTRTVLRSTHPDADEFEPYADQVVFPERAGGRVAVTAIEEDFGALEGLSGDLEVYEIQVTEGAPVAGKRLSAVSLPHGSLVVSDEDGDTVASADTVLQAGHRYVVAVEGAVADEVMNLFRG
jgi:trk system potassium uptake protein TrkA